MQPQYQQPYPAQPYAPPAQQPPMPQYPVQQTYPPQQTYAPAPVYAQPQYAPPAPQQPAQPTAPGTLDAFYAQPSTGGGKAWSFHNKPNGTTYSGVVARPVTNADIQQQTDKNTGAPKFYRDGRPMFVMIVPLLVPPSQDHPDGQAAWWVRGQARDELARAMAEAGAPEGPPEAGATVHVTKAGERPGRNGNNPSYQYRVQYIRPQGAAPVPVAPVVEQVPVVSTATGQPVMHQQAVPAPNFMAQGQTPPASPMYQQLPTQPVQAQPGGYHPGTDIPAPPMQAPAPVAQQPAPQPVAQAAPTPGTLPPGLSPEQQALFASLTGGTAAAPAAG